MSEKMFGKRGQLEAPKPQGKQEDFGRRLPMYERLNDAELNNLITDWNNIDMNQKVDGVHYDHEAKRNLEEQIDARYRTLTDKK